MSFYKIKSQYLIFKHWTPDKLESKYWNKNNRTLSNFLYTTSLIQIVLKMIKNNCDNFT